jgi:hypothetical protein
MIRVNTFRFEAIRLLLLVSLLVIVLIAGTGIPALAASGSFNNTGSMNVARIDHTATLLSNGDVLVAGGLNDGYLASAELYNPSTGKWTLTGSMTAPRDGHDAVLLPDGQVLVAGGLNATLGMCGTLSSAELYNPSTGKWTATGSMTTGRYSFALTLLPDGKVLAAGGTNCGAGGLISAELYNPATGKWTATGRMTTGNQTNWAILLQNGEVFVVGNDNLYHPSTGTWTATTRAPIFAHAPLVLLPNGDVRAAGTTQGDLIYNPSTAQWTTFAPPPCTRGGQSSQSCQSAAALLDTGKVLVAGGPTFVNARPYPIEETNGIAALFDPSTLTWTATGSMNTSRLGESMTVLLNGQALVAGGQTFVKSSGHLAETASAELYTP